MKKIYTGGYVVEPKTGIEGYYDIVVEGEWITDIMPSGTLSEVNKGVHIDLSGLTVVPGFVDLHVHLREPGQTYKETMKTGSYACAKGGFTTVACMPNTMPVIDSVETLERLKQIIKKDACIDVLPITAITHAIEGNIATDHKRLLDNGAMALSDDGKTPMNPEIMRVAFKNSYEKDALIISHCEDHTITSTYTDEIYPLEAETDIVIRDIELCDSENGRLHIAHVSGRESLQAIKLAKEKGVRVTCEVTPHHMALNDIIVDVKHPMAKVNPPIRSEDHRRAIIQGIKEGVVDIIATDHAPHDFESKNKSYQEAAYGISGAETAFSVAYETLVVKEKLPLIHLIEMMTSKPAEIARLRKIGSLQKGYYANFAVIDLEASYKINPDTFVSKGKNTPFTGMDVHGIVVQTLYRGHTVYER